MVKTRKYKYGDSGVLIYYAFSINRTLKDIFDLRKPGDEDSTIFRDVCKCLAVVTVWHPIKVESWETQLYYTQISQQIKIYVFQNLLLFLVWGRSEFSRVKCKRSIQMQVLWILMQRLLVEGYREEFDAS